MFQYRSRLKYHEKYLTLLASAVNVKVYPRGCLKLIKWEFR